MLADGGGRADEVANSIRARPQVGIPSWPTAGGEKRGIAPPGTLPRGDGSAASGAS